jgi:hypothetical protein
MKWGGHNEVISPINVSFVNTFATVAISEMICFSWKSFAFCLTCKSC